MVPQPCSPPSSPAPFLRALSFLFFLKTAFVSQHHLQTPQPRVPTRRHPAGPPLLQGQAAAGGSETCSVWEVVTRTRQKPSAPFFTSPASFTQAQGVLLSSEVLLPVAQAEGSLFLKPLMRRRKVNHERKTSLEHTGSNPGRRPGLLIK